ncbi:unnamed protein product, partial [Rotaria sp. Silwood1]
MNTTTPDISTTLSCTTLRALSLATNSD